MHPYIFYELDKYPCIYYDGNNGPIVVKMDNNVLTKTDSEFDEYYGSNDLEGGNYITDDETTTSIEGEVPVDDMLIGCFSSEEK